MAETYDSLVENARLRLNESLAEAAADAVVIADRFNKPLRAVVTDITADWPETHAAVYSRSKRIRNATSEPVSGGLGQPSPSQAHHVKSGRSAIKKHPELASELLADPEVRNSLRQALNRHDAETERQSERTSQRDPVTRRIDNRLAVQEIQTALTRHAARVTELLPQAGELSDSDKSWLESALEQSEDANTQVRYYIQHGETEIDAGLRELTGGQR
jgi:hypothetical protein